jgi:putative toxin-antitoxin system antitoxin component (TIGR02293 family)
MIQLASVAELLGGPKILKQRVQDERQLEQIVRDGLPTAVVRTLADLTETTLTKIQSVARIDRNTFARRARSNAKLKIDESDRIVRIARIAVLAIDTMGRSDGLAWLHEPNRALGGRIPLDLIDTEVGARQVENILGRIEHGIVS